MKVWIEFSDETTEQARRYTIGILPFLKVMGLSVTEPDIQKTVQKIMSNSLAEGR